MNAKVTLVEVTHSGERVLEETILQSESSKELTKGRASKLLARHYPELATAGRVILVDTDRGWCALRAIQPERNVWLNVYISKADV